MSKIASKLRWLIMIISFLILTYGVYILGLKIAAKYELPIFACPVNFEGSLGGSCYTLSHLKIWSSTQKLFDIVYFTIFTLIIIGLFGRLLCGFICPFGFIQDVIDKIRQLLRINQIKFSETTYKLIKVVKWVILALFLSGSFIWEFNFCSICPVIVFAPPFAGVSLAYSVSIIIAIIVVVGSFYKRRFWCNICPLGYLVGIFHKFSLISIVKDCQACTECGSCYEACPMGIKEIYTEREKKLVSNENCIMCLECINKCPEKNALSLSYAKLKLYRATRKNFFNYQNINKN